MGISLGNTLLASIVCLLWYVFGLWEDKVSEKEVSLTSAGKKVRGVAVDKEENFNNGSGHLCTSRTGGQEGHLYMLSEEGRHLLVEQVKQRQEEIQSTMQLKEEKAPIAQEERKTKSLEVTKSSSTTFQWPQNAAVLESARPTNSISSGLESDEEVKESPKPKKKNNKRSSNNNNNVKKAGENVSRSEKQPVMKPGGSNIRTGGWSNPAWKMVQPQPSPALVRAF